MVLFLRQINRSVDGWLSFGEGSIVLSNNQPLFDVLPVQMKFSLGTSSTTFSSFRNGDFSGMNIKAANYTTSFFYRPLAEISVAGGKLNIGFNDSTGQTAYGISIVDVSNAPVGTCSNFSFNISVFRAAPSSKNFLFIEFAAGSKSYRHCTSFC
jgi:hypothetical protein